MCNHHRVWRYGDQLAWRMVMIGLVESAQPQQYLDRGHTPERMADNARFERYGMPLARRRRRSERLAGGT